MTKMLKVLLTAMLLMQTGLCVAAEKKADPQSIQTLMVKSGLDKQLEQIAPMVQAGIDQQNQESGALSPAELEELNGFAAMAFDAKALKESVQKHVQANLSGTDVRAALAWLRSPLGEKITKLEEEASTPAAYAEMQKIAGSLTGNSGRVALVRKLDNEVKATENGVAVVMNTQIAIVAALTSGMAPEMRPTMEKIEKEMLGKRDQIKSAIEGGTILSLLYAYRGLSDAEISKYIEFAGSASGKKYHAITADGVKTALKNAAFVLGRLIAQNANTMAPDAAGKQKI